MQTEIIIEHLADIIIFCSLPVGFGFILGISYKKVLSTIIFCIITILLLGAIIGALTTSDLFYLEHPEARRDTIICTVVFYIGYVIGRKFENKKIRKQSKQVKMEK
jgi:hypothetical protein